MFRLPGRAGKDTRAKGGIEVVADRGVEARDATSFVLAGLSVTQLIFMSEVGVIILRSSLPISFAELLVIFLLRTAIVLPVLVVGGHLVVSY